MAKRPPSDPKPDVEPESTEAKPESDEVKSESEASPPKSEASPPKSEASPPKANAPQRPARPPMPERLNTVDIMPGTLIGVHLPKLIEEQAAKPSSAGAPLPPAAAPAAAPTPEHFSQSPPAVDAEEARDAKWRSPLQVGPAWLIHLRSIPPRLAATAIGGVLFGALVMSGVRGCVSGHRVDNLEERVGLLERTLGVSTDAGASATGGRTDGVAALVPADASGKPSLASASADPKKAGCAVAKVAAYQAWQDAVAKAKVAAAPAEAPCADMWTQTKKQACYYAASQGVRGAQAARDTVMKGGASARDAVKNVKDDPKNDAIAPARAASEAAFGACQDENEL